MTAETLVDEFRNSEQAEASRVRFLESSRGHDAAVRFARQTLAIYRTAVVHRSPPAGEARYRLRLMGSYCFLKQYLRDAGRDA